MLLACLLATLLLPHGGQYLPPALDGAQAGGVLTQPGTGPTLAFRPARWEWWYDFHEEGLIDLRARLRDRPAGPDGAPAWVPPDRTDRLERVLPVLEEAATRAQRDLRATAALALGRLGEDAALPTLVALSRDRDLFVKCQAILALGASGRRGALEPLEALLDDPGTPGELFTYAAAALGLLDLPEAAEVLAPRLRPQRLARTSQQERAALIHAAGLAGHPALDASLLGLREEFLWTHDGDVRALVAVALGRSGRRENLAPLLTLLQDPDNQVRRSAASALFGLAEQLDDRALALVLARHAAEKDLATRGHLLRVLGRARAPAARERLVAVLKRRSAGDERPFAALGLGLDGHPAGVDALLAELEDESVRSVRGAFAVALGLAGDPRAVAPLRALLAEETEPGAQGWLALALGLLGAPADEVAPRLERLLDRSHDPETLRLATVGLALLGRDAELRARLSDLPELRATVDRAAMLFAHGQVGDARSLPPLVELATDEELPTYLRRYALGALGQICEPRERSFTWRLSRLAEPQHEVGFLFELTRVY